MSSFVQQALSAVTTIFSGDGINDGAPVALPGAATIGNTLIVTYATYNTSRSVSSIVDGGSTTLTATATIQSSGAGRVQIFTGPITSTSAGSAVVATLSGSNPDDAQLGVYEVSGLATDQTGLGVNGTNNAATTTHTSGAATRTNGNDFVFALGTRTNGTYTDDADFTEVSTGNNNFYAGYLANPSGNTTLDFTSADPENSTVTIASLKGAASASVLPRLLLLGVG